ncbi:MAG: PKD repeat protein [Crocinitomicaceae bacterium]|jgi:PKD repeat protein
MKKLLLGLTALALTTLGYSQSLQPMNVDIYNDLAPSTAIGTKAAICGPDTVQYTNAKATTLAALSINNATSAQAISQYFNAPQPITISGAEFYAYKIDVTGGISINVGLKVYVAGPDSMPLGSPVASGVVAVDTNFGGGVLSVLRKIGTFTPVTMSVPYVVVIENLSPNAIGLVFNSWTAADGAGEWLSSVDLFGTWTRSYDVVVGVDPFDADMLIYPIVSYDLAANFTPSDQCMTTGPTITFTNTSSPVINDRMYNQAAFLGTQDLSYTWDYDDGSPLEVLENPFHVFPNTVGPFDVMLTDSIFGWTSICTADTLITLGLGTILPAYGQVSTGLSVDFTDMSTSSGTVASWLWDFGDGNTSTATDPTHIYATSGSYTVCLTVTNNCGAMDSTCSTVIVSGCSNPVPLYSFIDAGAVVTFTDASTSTSPPATYFWDFGDGNTSTLQNPVHTYATDGTYTACLTVTDLCGTDSTCQTVTVLTCTNPVAGFTVAGSDPTYDFTNTSTTTGTVTYSWDFGDATSSILADPSHTYTTNGTFIVVLTITDSCGTSLFTGTVTTTTIGLTELDFGNVTVFPNPSSDFFTIQSTSMMEEIDVLDVSGKIVKTISVNNTEAIVDATDLANGAYIFQVKNTNGTQGSIRVAVSR